MRCNLFCQFLNLPGPTTSSFYLEFTHFSLPWMKKELFFWFLAFTLRTRQPVNARCSRLMRSIQIHHYLASQLQHSTNHFLIPWNHLLPIPSPKGKTSFNDENKKTLKYMTVVETNDWIRKTLEGRTTYDYNAVADSNHWDGEMLALILACYERSRRQFKEWPGVTQW